MTSLRVRVLGEFAVDGVTHHELGSRKARIVLKLLVLQHGRPVSTDRLVDAVWSGDLPARPAEQLAVLVSRLRSVVGRSRITFGDAGYRLELDQLDIDEVCNLVMRAEDADVAGRHLDALTAARDALATARGPLLPDELDAAWAEQPRRAAERIVARARRVAVAAAMALGRFDEAIELAAEAMAADRYDEESLRQLMLAEQRRGRTAAGLAAYARMRAQLVDDLGVDLSRETEAVHLALLQDEVLTAPPAMPPRAADDVTPVGRLVGRQGELARLGEELARARFGHGRLVLIEGDAGIGKSALLRAFGRRAAAAGALWLHGACEPVFGELPMQSVVDALAAHVRTLSPVEGAELLKGEHAVLGSLLGTAGAAHVDVFSDIVIGNARLLQAFDTVLGRLAAHTPVVLAIDDVHLARASTADLLVHLARRRGGLLVVATRRSGAGPPIAAGVTIPLGPLALDEAVALVGAERGPALHARAGGNPLFLTQLAAAAPGAPLPESLVDAVADVAALLGDAGPTVAAAAVLGATIDVDVLAGVLGVRPLSLVAHLDLARTRGLLDDAGQGYAFRHALVRDALADATPPARAALLHREAARVLFTRTGADPLAVAHHAHLGGDTELAADALEEAAARAAQRFDRAAAEELLDRALRLSDTPKRHLARARIRTMRGDYEAALGDVETALTAGAGAPALVAGAWASYFARRFDDARSYADDGAALAGDPAVRASCLTIAGRVRHATGDLAGAEPLLREAAATAEGPARAVPTVWLGVLRSHQSRPREALDLLRPITRVESGAEQTTELLHALLFTGHAQALAGRPIEALEALARYDAELERRHVPRFAGRAGNFRGWVLRALGQWERADAANVQAADEVAMVDFPETRIASWLDLASSALLRDDAPGAADALERAAACFTAHLTFGWRLDLRLRLERARLALLVGRPAEAAAEADEVARHAASLGVARYATVARLVTAEARAATGAIIDLEAVGRDLDALDDAVGIDAWWVTAGVARALQVPAWRDRALARATALARAAGPEDTGLARAVARLID